MERFSELLNQLYFTSSHLTKADLLLRYLTNTPDPDRGYAIAIISGTLDLKFFKRSLIQELLNEEVDQYLFRLCYDYVGDFSETSAYLWENSNIDAKLPSLSTIITEFMQSDKLHIKNYLRNLLNHSTATQRWALLKIGTGSLRVGVSARFLKQVLAQYGNKHIHEIESIWHTVTPPYQDLFAWLEGKLAKPVLENKVFFHPVMLSHPLNDKELLKITAEDFFVEWKFDGIRIQLIITPKDKTLFSRSGDNISHTFPELLTHLPTNVVLDGELVIKTLAGFASFNQLQQRLNRKLPTKKLIESLPAHVIIYDILFIEGEDIRSLPLIERRQRLTAWYNSIQPEHMSLSPLLDFCDSKELKELHKQITKNSERLVEGLMLKRKTSQYLPGRPMGLWFKWKCNPFLVDAVLMYAQRGHGKRSSFYSDYTFGLWQQDQLLPIGKAYFGFTDEELKQLDSWIRHHTIKKFGPVREVEKCLVLEIAFEGVSVSKRHKSGYALRFPRVNRIRWDKPANEADTLAILAKLLH